MSNNHFACRAKQLDAQQLDRQFLDWILTQICQLKSNYLNQSAPELQLLIQIYLWFKKQFLRGSTIGLDTFKLAFYDASNGSDDLSLLQRCSFLLPLLADYAKQRLGSQLSSSTTWLIEKISAFINLLQVVNSFVFIYDGKYLTILQRLFGIKSRPLDQGNRPLSSSATFLIRQLLWGLLSEVLTLIFPLLITCRWIRFGINFLAKPRGLGSGDQSQSANSTLCQLCQQSANNATSFDGCVHLYCHYCISAQLVSFGSYQCNICETSIDSPQQLHDRCFVLTE